MTHIQRSLPVSKRSLTASAEAVYARVRRGVNRGIPRVAVTLVAVSGALTAGPGIVGCATPSVSTHPRERRSNPYLLSAACDVEPLLVGQSHGAAIDTLKRDFQDIARLGFDSAVLRHVDERERLELLETARQAGLGVVLPDRAIQYYARTGSLPTGVGDYGELPRIIPREIIAHPALASFVVEVGESSRSAARGDKLCAALGDRGLPCVLVGGEIRTGTRSLIRIDTAVGEPDSNLSPLEPWLARYHEGLSAGRTAGVVFDGYRGLPGDGPGIAPGTDPGAPARTAAIKALTTRARLWGPRLQNLTPHRIQVGSGVLRDLVVTAFIHGRRRYVLVFNSSAQSYARSEVVLPELVGGSAVARAVEVPSSRTKAAGKVVRPTRGRIVLPVILRPADAALFELF